MYLGLSSAFAASPYLFLFHAQSPEDIHYPVLGPGPLALVLDGSLGHVYDLCHHL